MSLKFILFTVKQLKFVSKSSNLQFFPSENPSAIIKSMASRTRTKTSTKIEKSFCLDENFHLARVYNLWCHSKFMAVNVLNNRGIHAWYMNRKYLIFPTKILIIFPKFSYNYSPRIKIIMKEKKIFKKMLLK